MRLALIPPLGYVGYANKSDTQLALPHIDVHTYLSHYTSASLRGHYVILDNGAAEGYRGTVRELVTVARRMYAHELVATDVLYKREDTLKEVERFLLAFRQLPERYYGEYIGGLKLMGVVQGTNGNQFQAMISDYAEDFPDIKVLGIPRLAITPTNLAMRIDLANWVLERYPNRFEIHFLGASPLYPHELKHAATYAPHVRSMDTSMPFNYAMAGIPMDARYLPAISRPVRYFEERREINRDLLNRNIEIMLGWAGVEAPVSQL